MTSRQGKRESPSLAASRNDGLLLHEGSQYLPAGIVGKASEILGEELYLV